MYQHKNARINVLGVAPHIVTDFGETELMEGEDERSAAIRVYRSWCLGTPGGEAIVPDPSPEVVLHDVGRMKNFQDFK